MMAKCSARARVMISFFVLFQASTSQTSCDFKWRDAIGGLVVGMLGTVAVHKLVYMHRLRIANIIITTMEETRKETGIGGFTICDIVVALKSELLRAKKLTHELIEATKDSDEDQKLITGKVALHMNKIYPEAYGPGSGTIQMDRSAKGYPFLTVHKGGKKIVEKYIPSSSLQSAAQDTKYHEAHSRASRLSSQEFENAFFTKNTQQEV